jgi:NTE family protein
MVNDTLQRGRSGNKPVPLPQHTDIALVLQGGGALGAYQGGVYDALANTEYCPTWVAGVSIGAINAALIAGNPPDRRVGRMREFWQRVSSHFLLPAPSDHQGRMFFNWASATMAASLGVPVCMTRSRCGTRWKR